MPIQFLVELLKNYLKTVYFIKATPQSIQKGFKGPELNTIQQSDIEYGLSIAKEMRR